MIPFYIFFGFFSLTINGAEVRAQIVEPDMEPGMLISSISYSAWTNQTIYQYLGMRYAKSPSGDNRFKAPIPAVMERGSQHVEKYGRPCPTISYLENMTAEELSEDVEDCLHLCVYTKDHIMKAPVMFYVHGGAFESHSSQLYPPNYLLEKDVVLVVPQFRLGPFGFLSTQTDIIPGNAALLDVRLALQWTQNHISHFGGDPARVTLFGQSSGAAMVSALMISPEVPPNLFHRAILQSGSSLSTRAFDFNPIQSSKNIAKLAGCTDSDTITNVNNCLVKLKPIDVLKAYKEHFV